MGAATAFATSFLLPLTVMLIMEVVSRWDALASPIGVLLALSLLPSVCAGPDCGHT